MNMIILIQSNSLNLIYIYWFNDKILYFISMRLPTEFVGLLRLHLYLIIAGFFMILFEFRRQRAN